MNRKEMIEALKKNEKAFGLMSKDLQNFCEEIPDKNFNFLVYSSDGWEQADDFCFCDCWTYRLRNDYDNPVETIELPITKGMFDVSAHIFMGTRPMYFCYSSYNVSPGIWKIGDKEVKFAGYKYADGSVSMEVSRCLSSLNNGLLNLDFPVAAKFIVVKQT